ncbi:MAG: methionyl-tRNA formyltransferase [Actinomycetota bacterium]
MTEPEVVLATPPETIERIVFLGTPDESSVALRALVDAGFDLASVITQPDRRRGRGGRLDPSPVKRAAVDLGLDHERDVVHDLDGVLDLGADLGVVVAYGRIIPTRILEVLPMVNIHFSLLPRWRGAAPVERAILAGDTRTGVCLMEVAAGLDTGGVYARAEVDIDPEETAAELRARLAVLGADLLVEHLRTGLKPAEPQVGEATYAAKLERDEFQLRFDRPAIELHRTVRLGRAWTWFRGKRLGVLAARLLPGSGEPGSLDGPVVSTPDGRLELVEVRPEGRRAQPAVDWLNGARPGREDRLG